MEAGSHHIHSKNNLRHFKQTHLHQGQSPPSSINMTLNMSRAFGQGWYLLTWCNISQSLVKAFKFQYTNSINSDITSYIIEITTLYLNTIGMSIYFDYENIHSCIHLNKYIYNVNVLSYSIYISFSLLIINCNIKF